jgi:hypothetical protein
MTKRSGLRYLLHIIGITMRDTGVLGIVIDEIVGSHSQFAWLEWHTFMHKNRVLFFHDTSFL